MRTVSILFLGMLACGDADPAPLATVVEFSPESLDPVDDSADDLTLVVEYVDADGDLGEGRAEVHDCRAEGLVAGFDLPPIASEQAIREGVPIEGSLTIVVADVGAASPDSRPPVACEDLGVGTMADGEAIFCVLLTDAAGHTGPGDCTGPVIIAP